ncbi:MAG: hypothetical protein LBR79_02270 [Oscillospiraceae bacterium]|jgi:hypothetical protein|nr:hypothetical protein [Oscillospiraceae bacterium]
MTWEDAGKFVNNFIIVAVCTVATIAATLCLLGGGTWTYNKITGSTVTVSEAGQAVVGVGALLAEWASVVKGGSKI